MKIEVFVYPPFGLPVSASDKLVVVLDILRATSTIVTALSHGAVEVIPVNEASEAVNLAKGLGSEQCLTGGERKGLKIEGFDLGNSPSEYTAEVVNGKKIILSTTNGTKAIKWAQAASELIIGSYLNLQAVVDYLLRQTKDIMIICAGRDLNLGIEDLACAGEIVRRMAENPNIILTDSARVAEFMAEKALSQGLLAFIRETDHACNLVEIGLENDIAACLATDQCPIVPKFNSGKISLI
jgi:2-phosphosulfolactate phosphatase